MHSSGMCISLVFSPEGSLLRSRSALLSEMGINAELGTIDISFYRDDLDHRITNPIVQSSEIPFEIEGNNIIVFDDVLYTGRTIRSAIQGVFKYGRPTKLNLQF